MRGFVLRTFLFSHREINFGGESRFMIDMERAMQFDTPEFEIRKINGSLDILETRIKELESRVAELEKQIEITDER